MKLAKLVALCILLGACSTLKTSSEYLARGNGYMKDGKKQQALAAYNKALALNPDNLDAEEGAEDEEPVDMGSEEDELAPEEEPELDIELGGEDELPADRDDEIELELNDDDDEDELNEENLGYTDDYQKDVFDKKPNMNEPADSKTTYSMDAGAPKGAEKPWAGKGDPKPFGKSKQEVDENVNECGGAGCVPSEEEANLEENGSGFNTLGTQKKVGPYTGKGRGAARRAHSEDGEYKGTIPASTKVNESMRKIIEKAKAIQAENKQYKDNIDRIKKALYEAAVLNINQSRIIDILVNETTTRDEKRSILERFNNVKTIKEGKNLQAAIKAELNEAKKSATPIVEKQFVAGSTKSLNETTIYSNAENPAMDLMNRMDNLYK